MEAGEDVSIQRRTLEKAAPGINRIWADRMKEQWAVVLGTSTLVCFKDNATSHNIKITVPLVEVSCTACFVATVSVHSGQFGKVTVPVLRSGQRLDISIVVRRPWVPATACRTPKCC